jgi:hypothetical protein
LRKAYVKRLEQLIVGKDIQVFANTKDFDYSAGDAVVEIVPFSGSVRFSVWGGFRMLWRPRKRMPKAINFGLAANLKASRKAAESKVLLVRTIPRSIFRSRAISWSLKRESTRKFAFQPGCCRMSSPGFEYEPEKNHLLCLSCDPACQFLQQSGSCGTGR